MAYTFNWRSCVQSAARQLHKLWRSVRSTAALVSCSLQDESHNNRSLVAQISFSVFVLITDNIRTGRAKGRNDSSSLAINFIVRLIWQQNLSIFQSIAPRPRGQSRSWAASVRFPEAPRSGPEIVQSALVVVLLDTRNVLSGQRRVYGLLHCSRDSRLESVERRPNSANKTELNCALLLLLLLRGTGWLRMVHCTPPPHAPTRQTDPIWAE